MECPKCRTENPSGAWFWEVCAQDLTFENNCPRYGHVNPDGFTFCNQYRQSQTQSVDRHPFSSPQITSVPASFANGHYQVKKFLAEVGKMKVYLTHDTVVDRFVAFALIKTEKLDQASQQQISLEAPAVGKFCHPGVGNSLISLSGIMGRNRHGDPYVRNPSS